jgi:hypothetical protein
MGFNYGDLKIHPVTEQLMSLRKELENTPWWHFIKRSNLKDAIYFFETQAIAIGIEQAINDLEKAGIVTRI